MIFVFIDGIDHEPGVMGDPDGRLQRIMPNLCIQTQGIAGNNDRSQHHEEGFLQRYNGHLSFQTR
jgi:hypothetical protein